MMRVRWVAAPFPVACLRTEQRSRKRRGRARQDDRLPSRGSCSLRATLQLQLGAPQRVRGCAPVGKVGRRRDHAGHLASRLRLPEIALRLYPSEAAASSPQVPTPAIAACTDTGDSGVADRAQRTRGVESLRSISGDQCRQAPQVGGLSGMAATGQFIAPACIGTLAPTSVS